MDNIDKTKQEYLDFLKRLSSEDVLIKVKDATSEEIEILKQMIKYSNGK